MQIYFGPPGTGKTSRLLSLVRSEADRGTPPDRIAFLSFSRRAAGEARARAATELGLQDEELRWWGTLHSTAARRIGVGPNDLMGVDHLKELGAMLNMRLTEPDEEGRVFEIPDRRGVAAQSAVALARARGANVRDTWNPEACHWADVYRLSVALETYKSERGLMDYADLLDDAPGGLPVDVVFLDEAQDLTPAQWSYFRRAITQASRVYVAGDDDQAIYEWAGADVRSFLDLDGEKHVLHRSHRLPRRIFEAAARVVSRIGLRQPKDWGPDDRDGRIVDAPDPRAVPVDEGNWLLLARTRYLASRWESECRDRGVPFVADGVSSIRPEEARAIHVWETARRGRRIEGWELESSLAMAGRDADLAPDMGYNLEDLGMAGAPVWHEALTKIPPARRRYYEACVRRNPKALVDPPEVTVSTIHGAKGAQAERVGLLTDIPPRAEVSAVKKPDPEHRVWYVAATRASQELHLVRPLGSSQYRL